MPTTREVPSTTRWLSQEEMAAWLPLLRVIQLLPQAMDRQLRKEAGIRHAYYQVLVHLSAQADRTLSMGQLARLAATSPSRLSHAVAAMEERGWVTRQPCSTDRRVQYASLTDAGLSLLERVAPGHVADVRRLVFDRLTEDEVSRLRSLMLKLLPSLDA
jgi:DNA-binding MarR family transcriptional regulator